MNVPCINSYTNKYNPQGPHLTFCGKIVEDHQKRVRIIDIHKNYYALLNTPVCGECWRERMMGLR